METNIILAGVGGQGILSIAYVIDNAALAEGLQFKQAEVHGMSQRGGAVQSHLRIADRPIASDLIPQGAAHMVLSVEPLEALRYVQFLRPDGVVVTSTNPYLNIPDYPEIEGVLARLEAMPEVVLLDSERLAKAAGSAKAQNTVMIGGAAPYLPLKPESIERFLREAFAAKGEKIVDLNLRAFALGREFGDFYHVCRKAGVPAKTLRVFLGKARPDVLAGSSAAAWAALLVGPTKDALLAALAATSGEISATNETAEAVRAKGTDTQAIRAALGA